MVKVAIKGLLLKSLRFSFSGTIDVLFFIKNKNSPLLMQETIFIRVPMVPSRLVPSFDPAYQQVGVLFQVYVSPFNRIG